MCPRKGRLQLNLILEALGPWDEGPANLTQIRWKNMVHGGGYVGEALRFRWDSTQFRWTLNWVDGKRLGLCGGCLEMRDSSAFDANLLKFEFGGWV